MSCDRRERKRKRKKKFREMTKARAEKNDFRAVGQQDAQTGLGAENYDRSGELAANQGEANCRNR